MRRATTNPRVDSGSDAALSFFNLVAAGLTKTTPLVATGCPKLRRLRTEALAQQHAPAAQQRQTQTGIDGWFVGLDARPIRPASVR